MDKEKEEGGEGDKKGKKERKKWGSGDRFGMGFRWSEKDRKALKWLAEQGTASVEQLWWSAWKSEKSSSPNYADERLRKMATGGFIKRERVFGSGRTNYIITDRGMREVKEADPDRADFYPAVPRRIDVREYGHTMALNWCRLFLEKEASSHIKNWMSDRALRSFVAKRESRDLWSDWSREIGRVSPDASFEFNGQRWLLEYEGTQKNKTKYQEKARELPYGRTKAVRGVIFVAATPKLKATIEQYFKHYECKCFTFDELKEGRVIRFLRDQELADEQREEEKLEAQAKEVIALRGKVERLRRDEDDIEWRLTRAREDVQRAKDACVEYGHKFFQSETKRGELLADLKRCEAAAAQLERQGNNLDRELSEALQKLKRVEGS